MGLARLIKFKRVLSFSHPIKIESIRRYQLFGGMFSYDSSHAVQLAGPTWMCTNKWGYGTWNSLVMDKGRQKSESYHAILALYLIEFDLFTSEYILIIHNIHITKWLKNEDQR